MTTLGDLPVGSSFTATCTVTARDDTSVTLDFGVGRVTVTFADGAVTGTWPGDVQAARVEPVAIAVAVNDVLMHTISGDRRLVAWVSEDGTQWSSQDNRQTILGTEKWIKLGHWDEGV